MDYDREITALAGETLALQALLTHLLAELSGGTLAPQVRAAFEKAEAELGRVEQEHPTAKAQITKARAVLAELHTGARGRRAQPN